MARRKKTKWGWFVSAAALAWLLWPKKSAAKPLPAAVTPDQSAGNATPPSDTYYTVVSGDTLSKIAAANGTTWQAIYDLNRDQISDPNLIYPGQRLLMP